MKKKAQKKKKRIKAKIRSKTELAGLITALQAENKTLADRLEIVEAQMANFSRLTSPKYPTEFPGYPHPSSWQPTWPYFYNTHEVRTEVQK